MAFLGKKLMYHRVALHTVSEGHVDEIKFAVAGLLGADQRPRFRHYVVTERHTPSYRWGGRVAVGETLPTEGVTYYEVPAEYGVRDYRYTVVNGHTVLVRESAVCRAVCDVGWLWRVVRCVAMCKVA